ncbi:MAG: CBS domain-containing protein [Candidatus Sericytochromatia bacterium]|nr:CBS domain-containing protein [Candidatus Sericytochromatia bacterium]
MKVIVTHINSDFDALGALIAASKLHSDAIPVIGYLLQRRVEEFLRLHKDAFNLKSMDDIDWSTVTDIIMVDFHELSRLEVIEKIPNINKINWTIYDHHPEQEMNIEPIFADIRETGSTVGIIVKYLKEKNIIPTFIEATVMALGIYADTGSLSFPNTKPLDALAVAWLLENHADLNIVSEYTTLTLKDEQIELMNELMSNVEILEVGNKRILFCRHSIDRYIHDLSVITQKLSDFYTIDLIFIAVKMNKWSYIISRSGSTDFNVLELMQEFNPKGHKQAGFAKTKASPDEIINTFKDRIKNLNNYIITARKIMSTPVRTITKITSVEHAQKAMLRYGHNGFIVVDNDCVEGIISRRDIEKAYHHKMNSSPVSDFMSNYIIPITPDTSFDQIEKLMIDNNIGRFPVIENGKLIGIVTRTDILKVIYHKNIKENDISTNNKLPKNSLNIIEQMKNHLSFENMSFLKNVGQLADKMDYKAYLVGGGVRDLIIENKTDVDLDIVIEGSAINFAKELSKIYHAEVTIHEKYGTAKLHLANETVDLATSRTEFYEYPAANPDVDFSTIKQDLYRRDFTINALAIHLNSDTFGEILDFFNGYKDISNKRIRVLHNLSFIEDPNRIFRAVRLERKLGFTIGRMTSDLIIKAMETGKFDYFINDRIKTEIKKIFTNKYDAVENIKRLSELKALNCFYPKIEFKYIENKLKKLSRYINLFYKISDKKIEEWVLFMAIILIEIPEDENFEKMLIQIRFTREEKRIVQMSRDLFFLIEKRNWEDMADSDIFYFWKRFPDEVLLYAVATLNEKIVKKSIYKYWTKLKKTKVSINGDYLKSIGIGNGKFIGDILESVLLAKLNGKVISLEDEYNFSRSLINDRKK